MEAELNFQYLSLAYLNKKGKSILAGEGGYFVSSLPGSTCQKKENRKIDEIKDVQGFS